MPTLTKAIAALLLLASGCRPALTEPGGTVEVTRVSGGVRLVNDTGRPVAYAVWNPGWLALLALCTDPGPGCASLRPGDAVVVPDGEIGGYTPDTREALVRWWHVVPDGAGGYRADAIHEVALGL